MKLREGLISRFSGRVNGWKNGRQRMGETDYSKRVDELKEAAEPLVDYLYKYGTPYDVIIVKMDSVEHLSGEAESPIEVRD